MDRVFCCDYDRGGAGGSGEAAPSALPCLFSNNSIEPQEEKEAKPPVPQVNRLTGMHKRTAKVLALEIADLAKRFTLERLGFLTLTFADNVVEMREAQRRFNSLATNVLRHRYKRAIGVWERQKRGAYHCHLVVVLPGDIRTGFDFESFTATNGKTGKPWGANRLLRGEWAFWRQTAKAYGFGRCNLLPVRSTAEGIARYVGKYVSKHINQRREADKGARLVRYIGYPAGARVASLKFGSAGDKGWLWRAKVQEFARKFGIRSETDGGLEFLFGHRWAFRLQTAICDVELPSGTVYPSEKIAMEEFQASFERQIQRERFESLPSPESMWEQFETIDFVHE
jgi:hypothetical protein